MAQLTGSHQDMLRIRKIWQELDPLLIASSFDQYCITTRKLGDYSSQLRHCVGSSIFVDDVVPIDLHEKIRKFLFVLK